jgi:hypothetical protein
MADHLRRNPQPTTATRIVGFLLSWGGPAVLVIAFLIAWLVRIDADWVIDIVDSIFPGLIQRARDLP